MTKTSVQLKPAVVEDVPVILSLIQELAEYERLPHEVVATEERLGETLFGPRPYAEAVLAWDAGEPVGIALFFHNYSTFLARPGIYLEDLYVRPQARRRGIGRQLLLHLARLAKERDCGRVEWSVLDWNEPSIEFYKNMGARAMDEWTTFRLAGEALDRAAALADEGGTAGPEAI